MLEKFGLSKQEIAVYSQLSISKGKTGYVIAKDINMSRSNVYPILNSLIKIKNELLEELQEEEDIPDGYFTIEGETNIKNKINSLVSNANSRVYVCGKKDEIFFLNDILVKLCEKNKKVVVITDNIEEWDNRMIIYKSEHEFLQVGLIVDSDSAIVGNIYGEEANCLYSRNKNFVISYKINLKNEIEVIEMKR